MDDRWLSVDEIAQHLGVSKDTVYSWLADGKVPAHRVGKLWKFKTSEIDDWVTKGGASTSNEKKAVKKSAGKSR